MKKPIEGDLFKTFTLYGKTFELRYGYYEDYERESEFGEPIPIYPDFLKSPMYTDDGYPFVTQMQEVCEWSESRVTLDACCADCIHYRHGDELIGICGCVKRRRDASKTPVDSRTQSGSLEDRV